MRTFIKFNNSGKFNPDPKPEKTVKVKKVYKYKRKPTGEAAIFKEIWNERPHVCQICNCIIPSPEPGNFLHVLPKAQNKYPKMKLFKPNIVLGCDYRGNDCHHNWDNNRSDLLLLSFWDWMFELEASLKEQYKKL